MNTLRWQSSTCLPQTDHNTMNTAVPITCDVIHPKSLKEAQTIIQEASKPYTPVVFLSNEWLSCWLGSLPSMPEIILFKRQSQTIGFALLGISKPMKFLPFRIAHLNQSGQQQQDQVWVEFNNLIGIENAKSACIEALIKSVFRRKHTVRFVVSMCSQPESWTEICDKHHIVYEEEKFNAYRLRLPLLSDEETLLAEFSSNTRQQLRRSMRSISETLGAISVTRADDKENLRYLAALGELHVKKWGNTPEGSGFENPCFLKHHKTFITTHPEKTTLLKLTAGETTLGYGYYLLDGNTALFYCAGINHTIEDNKAKPGYLLHLYAMRYFSEQGFTCYDYMAGEFRYKRSLSNETYSMSSLTLFNPNPIARAVETIWRWVKKTA